MSIQNGSGPRRDPWGNTCDSKDPGACVISSDELSSIVEIVNQNIEEASAHTNLTYFYE